MRHLKKGRKFGKKRGPRRAFIRILANNLILRERITTTEARAKELRSVVERLVTYGKKQNIASLRRIMQKVPKEAAFKMYHTIAPRYMGRNGGYTRVTKLAITRKNDGARMATIEFI